MKFFLFILIGLISCNCFANFPNNWQLGFQKAATPIMEDIELLHRFLMYVLTSIVVVVFGLLAYIIFMYNARSNPIPSKTSHNVKLEIVLAQGKKIWDKKNTIKERDIKRDLNRNL